MNDRIIEQVPFSRLKSCCPRCRTLCRNTQSYNVRLKEKKCEVECMLLYCRSCKIPFADFDIVQTVYERHRRALILFCPDCSWTIYDIISYMTTAKEQDYSYKYSYRVVSRQKYHNKSPRSIYHCNKIPKKCVRCGASMKEGDVLIPISTLEAVLVPVKGCSKCSVFYVKGKSNLMSVLMDNPYAKGITLNDTDYSRFTINQERKRREAIIRKKTEKLNSIPNASILLSVRFDDIGLREVVIVDQKNKVDHGNLIFHYSSEDGREFLTAAYAENARHKKGSYGNHAFIVEDVFTIDLQKRSVPIRIQQTDLMIRAGGGFYENGSKIVDILLYSPFTNRYEIIRATQYPCENMYYTDIWLFREFLKKYGNPGVCLSFFQSNGRIISSSSYSYELREESILKCYGYNVNKKDGHSQDYRQRLLAEIVDLNILSVSDIVHHIEWCIDSHSSPCFSEACWKWKQDLLFITNYKACPERFLIAEMNVEKNDVISR